MIITVLALSTMIQAAGPDAGPPSGPERLRVIIETDAGGDPDDEQSMVRFLLYTSEWDVEGIIANRPEARDGENLSRERTGLGIVRALLEAYGQCHPSLLRHDRRFPSPEVLRKRTVAGYGDLREGEDLVMAAADAPDPRPVWFLNWGTDQGSAPSCLRRALDRVLRERGPAGYAAFKKRFRLSSYDVFGDHTALVEPPFPLWVDTFHPERDGKRWYHRFSALTARAGGFDLRRDVLEGHGPLGALYPTNTGFPQKEGDTMCFLYLVPTGLGDPGEPGWGSWGGRYGRILELPALSAKPYFWAGEEDSWSGTKSRDNTLARWAVHLQNDFRARLDWCVKDFAGANHPPEPVLRHPARIAAAPGERIVLDASGSRDPDGNALRFEWVFYPEPGTYRGPPPSMEGAGSARAVVRVSAAEVSGTIHIILMVTDDGDPPLTRYRRIFIAVDPGR